MSLTIQISGAVFMLINMVLVKKLTERLTPLLCFADAEAKQ